jgi:hypothetical protein
MPQYLVANYLPDDFDPSTLTEEMIEEIHALNREMIAAGARKFACGISPAANAKTLRKQFDGRVLITDGRTLRPRSTWADSGYWKPPIWMRHWHGRRRRPSPAMCPARCASFFSTRLRNKGPAEASKQPGHNGLGPRGRDEMNGPAQCSAAGSGESAIRGTMKYLCCGCYDKGNSRA